MSTPNGSIRVYRFIPLDNSYDNTIYFNGTTERDEYFNNQSYKVYTEQMYTKLANNRIKLNLNVNTEVLTINYISFNTSPYGNFTYYAFVTNIDKISDKCVLFEYEIDVMMTYFNRNGRTLEPTYVLREHSINDVVGENLEEEPIALGEMIDNHYGHFNILNDSKRNLYIQFTNNDSSFNPATAPVGFNGVRIGNAYSALNYAKVNKVSGETDTEFAKRVQIAIQAIIANKNTVQNVFQAPFDVGTVPHTYNFLGSEVTINMVTSAGTMIDTNESIEPIRSGALDTYTPKNNKLYTYPYNYLVLSNKQGGDYTFRYEFFTGNVCTFTFQGILTPLAPFRVYPTNYHLGYIDYALQIQTGSPCAWISDSYQQWWAQNKVNMGLSVLNSAISIGAGIATGGTSAVMGGVQAVNSAINMGEEFVSALHAPNPAHNTNDADLLASLSNGLNVQWINRCVNRNEIKVIDDFFSRYGYAVNRLKIPNLNSRPHWNYIKTKNFNCKITAPAPAINKIKSIFDRGITFWKNPSEVGNFSLDNTIN